MCATQQASARASAAAVLTQEDGEEGGPVVLWLFKGTRVLDDGSASDRESDHRNKVPMCHARAPEPVRERAPDRPREGADERAEPREVGRVGGARVLGRGPVRHVPEAVNDEPRERLGEADEAARSAPP